MEDEAAAVTAHRLNHSTTVPVPLQGTSFVRLVFPGRRSRCSLALGWSPRPRWGEDNLRPRIAQLQNTPAKVGRSLVAKPSRRVGLILKSLGLTQTRLWAFGSRAAGGGRNDRRSSSWSLVNSALRHPKRSLNDRRLSMGWSSFA